MRSAKSKGAKDPEYLAWIRSLPCVICFWLSESTRGLIYSADREGVFCRCLHYPVQQDSRTEAAHVGTRGMSQKCSDREVIPLCGHLHHREGPKSHHKLGKRFFDHHAIDKDVLVAELNRQYETQRPT